jgi:hypothetical protein
MKRSDWLKKKEHAAETIHCGNGEICVMIHDAEGRQAEGFGKNEEAAFAAALEQHQTRVKRATLTTAKYKRAKLSGTVAA